MLTFRPGRSDEPPGSDLLDEMIAHLDELYPGRAENPGSVIHPEQMIAPHGIFLVGHDEAERPVACGGVRGLEDGVAEIKRVYVVPDMRSRGAGRELLLALEDAAREIGYERVRLDSGPQQIHAQALFRAIGYVTIERYNDNHIASYFAEKRL